MKIILTDKTELSPIMVTGEHQYIQNANRDTLTFVFDGTLSVDELDALFAEDNCETITIVDNDTEAVYNGYTIRVKVTKEKVEVEQETATSAAVTEDRITVTMGQRTYTETLLKSLL